MAATPTLQQVLNAAARATGIGPVRGSDSRFFATTKKGELHELKEELNSPKPVSYTHLRAHET